MKRIQREIVDLKKEDLGSIVLEPAEDNLYVWKGSIPGPPGSVYEGGVFNVEFTLPSDYPYVFAHRPINHYKLTVLTPGLLLRKQYSRLGELGHPIFDPISCLLFVRI